MKRLLVICLCILTLSGCGNKSGDGDSQKTFTIAYLPVEDTTEIQEIHGAFQEDLGKVLDMKVESYQTTSYSAAIEAVTSGRVDMVMLTPFSYVVATSRGDIELIAEMSMPDTGEDAPFSCIFTKSDSELKSIEDLKGTTFAFGDPASTTGHLIPKYKLVNDLGLSVDELENSYFGNVLFSGGHDKTIIGIIQGAYDAGASYCQMPEMLEASGVIEADDVKVIGTAGSELGFSISGSPVVVRSGIDEEIKSKLVTFLLDYENEAYFAAAGIEGGSYFETKDSNYDGLRKMADALGLTEEELLGE